MEKYRTIVGLEIHIEQNTKSKMFCTCPADYFGKEPNTHTCPVCLGMPGGLPVPNLEAVKRTILLGKALNCRINNKFKFDRKHYFYADLAKGYQISQYDEPVAENGSLTITVGGVEKTFRITRVHLEEDTGKLSHQGDSSVIDYNRGGVPLIEIVTEPDFEDGDDIKAFLEELQVIVRYLGIANADMEKGDMRLEPNISVQTAEKYPELPNYKVEVKNINSFRFVKKAVDYERNRHIEILESGSVPKQETRGWDNNTGTTVSQRSKENAADYRYFPEPDIPPFYFSPAEIDEIASEMPELPYARLKRYVSDFGIKHDDAFTITRNLPYAQYFETLLAELATRKDLPKGITNQTIASMLLNKKIDESKDPKAVIDTVIANAAPIETDLGVLDGVIKTVIANNEKAINDYRSGSNPNAIMFLMGQVMKEMKGKADAGQVKEALVQAIGTN